MTGFRTFLQLDFLLTKGLTLVLVKSLLQLKTSQEKNFWKVESLMIIMIHSFCFLYLKILRIMDQVMLFQSTSNNHNLWFICMVIHRKTLKLSITGMGGAPLGINTRPRQSNGWYERIVDGSDKNGFFVSDVKFEYFIQTSNGKVIISDIFFHMND